MASYKVITSLIDSVKHTEDYEIFIDIEGFLIPEYALKEGPKSDWYTSNRANEIQSYLNHLDITLNKGNKTK